MKRIWQLVIAGLMFLSCQSNAQTVEYIHTDALGSPVAVTDVNKTVVERSEYEPYGALLARNADDRPGFTGHVVDAESGLSYMQQRYYDPQIGRFLTVDPVGALQGGSLGFNRYKYAANNPYAFKDPDGRQECRSCEMSYGASVGAMFEDDPEKMRVWMGGEAAATFAGSGAESGAALGQALTRFVKTGDYSKEAVATAAMTAIALKASRGRQGLPHMRVQDISRRGAAESNYKINWTQKQFESHLKANGFTSQSQAAKGGTITNWFDKDGNKAFTTRDFSKSGGASAELHKDGAVAAKIRFEEGRTR